MQLSFWAAGAALAAGLRLVAVMFRSLRVLRVGDSTPKHLVYKQRSSPA